MQLMGGVGKTGAISADQERAKPRSFDCVVPPNCRREELDTRRNDEAVRWMKIRVKLIARGTA